MTEVTNNDFLFGLWGLVGLVGLFGLFSSRCIHEFGDVHCENDKQYQICKQCGKKVYVNIPSCNHSWTEIKDGYQVCKICGKNSECFHVFEVIEKQEF